MYICAEVSILGSTSKCIYSLYVFLMDNSIEVEVDDLGNDN